MMRESTCTWICCKRKEKQEKSPERSISSEQLIISKKGKPQKFQSWRLGSEKSDIGNERPNRRQSRTQVGGTLPSGQDSPKGSLLTSDGHKQAITKSMECRASQEILSLIFMYFEPYYLIT